MNNEYLIIAKTIKPHGIKGEVKVEIITDINKPFRHFSHFYILEKNKYKEVKIEKARYQDRFAIIKLDILKDRNMSETFRNIFIYVNREDLPELPKDTFLICDLIGLNVFDSEDNAIGVLTDVTDTGNNLIMTIKSKDKNSEDKYLPFAKEYIDIDISNKRITVDISAIEGLI